MKANACVTVAVTPIKPIDSYPSTMVFMEKKLIYVLRAWGEAQ
ncbi:MAG: hypothetical protein QXP86_04590 [Nitrososphaerota archaeon]